MKNWIPHFIHQQRGVVVLLIVLSIVLIGGVGLLAIVAGRSTSEARLAESARQSEDMLSQAKDALLAYLVQKTDGGQGTRLGNLPIPDAVNSSGTTITFDGKSDSRCLSGTSATGLTAVLPSTSILRANQRCLGKFPWVDVPLRVGDVEAHDPLGQVPWLAISPNLNYWDGCLRRTNSDLGAWTFSAGATACPAIDNTIPYPWMTVVDAQGNVLSNRVAAVLIAPGAPIQTTGRNQIRTAATPGFAGDYLDAIAVPLGCTSTCAVTFDNANLSNTFIQIPPGTRFPANAENAGLAGTPLTSFNDQLLYITVDEIIERLERRVLAEMKAALEAFQSKPVGSTATLGLPWAVPYSTATNNGVFNATSGTHVGMFPFFATPLGSPPVGFTAPSGNQTGYQWNITSLQAVRACKQVSTTPPRWANLAQGSASEPSVLAGSGTGLATWRGTRGIRILTAGGVVISSFAKTFSLWASEADCSGATPPSGIATDTYVVTRSITAFEFECLVAPSISYALAAPGGVQTYNWSCPTNSNLTTGVTVSDTLSSVVPASASYGLPTNGAVNMNQLRYQPIMPAWFYYDEWYKTAFYAVGPSVAPGVTPGCGGASSLTVGSRSGVNALLVQAGGSLSAAARPTLPPTDYLEGKNATAAADCAFEDTSKLRSSNYNDRLMVVSP